MRANDERDACAVIVHLPCRGCGIRRKLERNSFAKIARMATPGGVRINLWKKQLGSVPDSVWEREDVETLVLANNGLREVSERIGRLKRLGITDLGLKQFKK